MKTLFAILLLATIFVSAPGAATPEVDSGGFVYLGTCAEGTWLNENPTFAIGDIKENCTVGGPTEILAMRGAKIRDTLPNGPKFGLEVGRIKKGQRVWLFQTYAVGENHYWGDVALFPVRSKARDGKKP